MVSAVRIRDARKKEGLTQKELGERMGISHAAVAQYESGKRTPKVDTLKRIADAMCVPLIDLMDIGNSKNENTDNPDVRKLASAYDIAPPFVRRIVEVALGPYMPGDDEKIFG